jgi:hypothetical protein
MTDKLKIMGQHRPPSKVEGVKLPEGWCVNSLASPRTKLGAVKVYLATGGWYVKAPESAPYGPMPLADSVGVADLMVMLCSEGHGYAPADKAAEAYYNLKKREGEAV